MSELSTAPIHRILRKAGAERVSEEAAEELKRVLEEVGMRIAEQSVLLAYHAGRRTVKKQDVERASQIVLRSSLSPVVK
ncbi:MAG: histone family protein [Aigarchaeota archaeon]|nr:histone family protein [Aigarchaeota archaeon]MDW8093263.1 histone family protein [Nitrososphaerota archaeon]